MHKIKSRKKITNCLQTPKKKIKTLNNHKTTPLHDRIRNNDADRFTLYRGTNSGFVRRQSLGSVQRNNSGACRMEPPEDTSSQTLPIAPLSFT